MDHRSFLVSLFFFYYYPICPFMCVDVLMMRFTCRHLAAELVGGGRTQLTTQSLQHHRAPSPCLHMFQFQKEKNELVHWMWAPWWLFCNLIVSLTWPHFLDSHPWWQTDPFTLLSYMSFVSSSYLAVTSCCLKLLLETLWCFSGTWVISWTVPGCSSCEYEIHKGHLALGGKAQLVWPCLNMIFFSTGPVKLTSWGIWNGPPALNSVGFSECGRKTVNIWPRGCQLDPWH